jgi:ABC-type antimicrobial peptide transport system permease subunit
MVVGRALAMAVIGVATGLAAAVALTRVIGSLLYSVSATDPFVFTGVSVLLTATAGLAGYFPARRASRVDPIVALRHE